MIRRRFPGGQFFWPSLVIFGVPIRAGITSTTFVGLKIVGCCPATLHSDDVDPLSAAWVVECRADKACRA
eukprot:10051907-Lingulodinium_polyedra.AAC.1